MKTEFRSDCPINFALELFGDKWSLLIIRDILLAGKTSYNEFLESDEKIATNILANRLKLLEQRGLITKQRDPNKGSRYIYSPTAMALELIPVLIEVMLWGTHCRHLSGFHEVFARHAQADKSRLTQQIRDHATTGIPIWEYLQ